MSRYIDAITSILDGIPWTLESAQAAGFQTLDAACTRVIKYAHFLDDAEEQIQLDVAYDAAVKEFSAEFGQPLFNVKAPDGYLPFLHEETERAAGWEQGESMILVKLCYGDNTRIRMLDVGVFPKQELKPPKISADWWDKPPWHPGE